LPAESKRTLDYIGLPDQLLTLRVSATAKEVADELDVRVVFDGISANHKMRLETCESEEARWVLGVAEARLPTGLHLFHFIVENERLISADHAIVGDSNAILASEPVHKYILVREQSGVMQNVSSYVPRGRSVTGGFETNTAPMGLTRSSAHDDAEVATSTTKTMARPHSFGHHLVELGNDKEEVIDAPQGSVTKFRSEVFEGLFDGELRFRMDGYVLPETPGKAPQEAQNLKLWSGAHILKKKFGACEDAFFINESALGVADGVGCMVQFAKYGVNAAAYATGLMEQANLAFAPGGVASADANDDGKTVEQRAAASLVAAEDNAEAYGASTIIVLALEGDTIGVANLGDSGFLLLRKAQRGMTVVARSEEQQHSWNCPYQLTRLPEAIMSKVTNQIILDTAKDCVQFAVQVREGDLLLLFSDGLRDNLHEQEILNIVDCALPPAFGELMGLLEHATPPESVARSLALAAQERSLDPKAKVPFVEYSRQKGYQCMGAGAWRSSPHPPQPARICRRGTAGQAGGSIEGERDLVGEHQCGQRNCERPEGA